MSIDQVSVVVPVYNESESLEELHRELTDVLGKLPESYEIIYVDDGSEDDSFEHLSRFHEADPEHIKVVKFRRNFGQTAAIAAGFDVSTGQVVITIDADLQNDPADIPLLLQKIRDGNDVVSGWRRNRQDKFLSRRLPSVIANRIISYFTGVRLHDYGCTLKAYRRGVIQHLRLYGEMHRYIPALANWSGAIVEEVAVNHRPRKYGQSKYGINRTIRVITDLVTIKFLLSYSTKPMQIFGKWGFLIGMLGMLSGFVSVFRKFYLPKEDITNNPWLYIAIFLSLTGLQLIALGILGELTIRTYYESQMKKIYTVRKCLGVPDPTQRNDYS